MEAARSVSTAAFCFAAKSVTSCAIFIEQKLSSPHSFASAASGLRPGPRIGRSERFGASGGEGQIEISLGGVAIKPQVGLVALAPKR